MNNDTEHDIIDSVKRYGMTNGVEIFNVHVIYNIYSDSIVGCKINVLESKVESAMCESFWPTDTCTCINCRLCQRQRPRDQVPDHTRGDVVTHYNQDNGSIRRTVQQS